MTGITLGDLIRGTPAVVPIQLPESLSRIGRFPAISILLWTLEADADLQNIINNPGYQTILRVMGHPAAQQIIADHYLLLGRQTGFSGFLSMFTEGSKYGVNFDAEELLPALSDILSIAADMPVDASGLTEADAIAILDAYQSGRVVESTQAATAVASGPTPNNIRISRTVAAALAACATVACAPPFLGGAHACTMLPPGDGMDSHHMPADSASPLPRWMGPAIKMDPMDHRQTTSYGGGANGPAYSVRRALIAGGHTHAAFLLDVQEIRNKFPGKYDLGLAQATAYAACLKTAGLMN